MYDLDLFIFLPDIRIHIATGGAKIPKDLINLTNNNLFIYNYFNQEEFLNSEIELNPKLEEIVYSLEREKNPEFNFELYLESFTRYAERGFYSFDKTNINDPSDRNYHLVSYPKNENISKISVFVALEENQRVLNHRETLVNSLLEEIQFKTFNSKLLLY
jgi:hypothetical protein